MRRGSKPRVLALVPLPYLLDGRPTFQRGVSLFYADLLPRLANLGHEVCALAEAPDAPPEDRRSGLNWPGLRVQDFALAYRSGRQPALPAWCEETRSALEALLAREIDFGRPDVVLIGREILAPPALAACRERKLPAVVVAHGPTLASLGRDDYPEAARRALIDALRSVDRVIAVAKHLEATLRALGVRRTHVIGNGVDTELFRPAPPDRHLQEKLQIAPGRVVITHISTLAEAKRPVDLVMAAEIALVSRPDLLFLVIGRGSGLSQMKARARTAGIAADFRFAGEVPRTRIPQYLNLSDVVVSMSQREGLSLVYREAQACGRALLASDIPAAREAIADGESGRLFRTGDASDLAAKLLALAAAPAMRDQIGRQARTVAESWSLDHVAKAYSDTLLATPR